jgi:D-arabinose 1-dehydrogenase-like Zn-dependent alcohol dehydrogenase
VLKLVSFNSCWLVFTVADINAVKGILGNSKVMLKQAVALTEEHDLHPEINVFAWEDAKKAYEAMRSHNCVGKIVIQV